ncbi:SDR family NAD(P)-dependent oxidoreductase [bacterium]|nr:SDR family NAD(P)-dependent oxidoreductase [bacterium]
MSKRYFMGRRIWITGASTGIGAACAKEFARRGAYVALSARSEEKLSKLAKALGPRAFAAPCDVTDKESLKEVVARITNKMGGIDTAFLNAGTWQDMDLDQFDSALFEHIMTVNYLGLVHGIEAVLPELMRSKSGHLVGMSSSVAYRGMPRAEAYCASKSAVRAMLQGLRCQLKPHDIPTTIVMPGFVKSPLTDRNDFAMPFLMETSDAARIIADGIAKRRSEIKFPWQFILMMKLMAHLPDSTYTALMTRMAVSK